MLSFHALAPLIVGLFVLLLSFWVVTHEKGSQASQAFSAFSFCLFIWLFAFAGLYMSTNEKQALQWTRLGYIGVSLIPGALYLFVLQVVESYEQRWFIVWAAGFVGVFFAGLAMATNLLIADVYNYWWGFYPAYGRAGIFFLGYFVAVLVLAMWELCRAYQAVTVRTQKRRLRVLIGGVAIAYGGSIDFLPKFGWNVYPGGYAAIFLFGLIAAYAIYRYQLVDYSAAFAADRIMETVRDLVIVTDRRGKIHFINAAAEQMLGYRTETLVGLSVDELTASSIEQGTTLSGLLEQAEARDKERHFGTREDGEIPVSVSAAPLFDRHQERVGTVLVARDIRKRKQAEQQLREAKEEAEEMSRLKSSILSNISHEVRTPLAKIMGYTDLLAEEYPESAGEFIEIINRSGNRLLNTLNRIIDLARLEAGEISLQPEPVDVVDQTEDVVSLFQSQAYQKGLSLQFSPSGPSILAQLDPTALRRILNNLISNAVKFTSKGFVEVRLERTTRELIWEIEDTGPGFEVNGETDVMEAFRQKSTGLTREHEGIGLGLTIAFRVAEVMNGTLEVESAEGEGTCMILRLPHRTPN